jgi:hypothetical protein
VHLAGQIPLSDFVDAQNKEPFTLHAKPPEGWDAQTELDFDKKAEDRDHEDEPAAAAAAPEPPEPARMIAPRTHGQIVDVTATAEK